MLGVDIENAAELLLKIEEMGEFAHQLVRPFGCAREKCSVALIRRIVLLNEIPYVDFVFPGLPFESFPCFHTFVLLVLLTLFRLPHSVMSEMLCRGEVFPRCFMKYKRAILSFENIAQTVGLKRILLPCGGLH